MNNTSREQTEKILEQVAKNNNTTVEEVKREISKAMDAAMQTNDSDILSKWDKVPCSGNKPTPEEVMSYIGNQAAK